MCTIVLAVDALDDAPLAVAATREEVRDRPAEAPAIRWADSGSAVLAPLDRRAGGTWIGVNADGLFAAVANRWVETPIEGERSRGLLVKDALGTSSVGGAFHTVRDALERDRYAPFRLVIGSGETGETTVLEWPGGRAPQAGYQRVSLDAGVHVVTNVSVDDTLDVPPSRGDVGDRQLAVAERSQSVLDPDRLSGDSQTAVTCLDRAASAIADHDVGACVHGEYGTRSSSLLAIDGAGAVTYRFADGLPCEQPFETVWAGRPIAADSAFEG